MDNLHRWTGMTGLAATALLVTLIIGFLFPADSSAQYIRLKTAPVATGDQFLIRPSVNAGMGNLSIALDDTLGDSFVNPAKAWKIKGARLYTLPTFYRISDGNGGARTLSVGGISTGEQWFGGLGVAVQEMDPASGRSNFLKDESSNNNYVWVHGGKLLDENLAIGAALYWAGLGAMDGVDLLYPRSQRIEQNGNLMDIRIGLQGYTDAGGQYEALALYSRTDMKHEVSYLGVANNTGVQTSTLTTSNSFIPPEPQIEENLDITNTWGAHVGYDQPAGENGWRVGSAFTFNYKTHPKIPNYELMNIPRDPGNTWAFNLGAGTSVTSEESVTFGIDLVFEPIWSNTWVDAEEDILTPDESRVRVKKGEKTIENDFEFLNSIIKTGIGWRGSGMILQAGVQAKTYRYHLKQKDYIQGRSRRQNENWTEWVLSFSIGAEFTSFEIRYTGLLTAGSGQPGRATTSPTWARMGSVGFSNAALAGDFIFAPSGDLALENATVFTNHISLLFPF